MSHLPRSHVGESFIRNGNVLITFVADLSGVISVFPIPAARSVLLACT